MHPRDVSPYEMSDFSNIQESDLQALLSGQVPSDDSRLGDAAAFLEDLAVAVPEPSTSHCEERHLSAMFEQAHLLAEKGEPAAMPASKADGPDDQVAGLPKPRRKTMLDKLKESPLFSKLKGASLATKIAAVTAAFTVMFSGMAFAGVLPEPVQDATADAVAGAGIDLPGGADEEALPASDEDADDADEATEVEDVDDADATEDADDDGEAEDGGDADVDDDADDDGEAEDEDDADEADEAEGADDDDDDRATTTPSYDDDDDDDDETAEPDDDDDSESDSSDSDEDDDESDSDD